MFKTLINKTMQQKQLQNIKTQYLTLKKLPT